MQDQAYLVSSQPSNTRAAPIDGRTTVVEAVAAAERQAKYTAPLEPTSEAKARHLMAILATDASTGTETQVRRLRTAMRLVGEITCLEAQRYLDIRHPPARVLNMTHSGDTVMRRWVRQMTERGHEHRTMSYSLGQVA